MRDFDFAAPRTLDEAMAILAQADGQQVRVLAGGTDLIDQIRQGRKSPSLVMDMKQIPEMRRLAFDPREGLYIGAAATCQEIAGYPPVRQHYPALAEACSLVGSIQIQNRASVGGNVCNAAPSADTVPPLLVHGALAVVAGAGGRRQLPLDEFFLGPGQTVLAANEIMLAVIVPPPPANSASHYLRFTPREEMDIAVAGVGSLLVLEPGSRRCRQARLALAAVAPTPIRAREAEASLEGQLLGKEHLVRAGELAAQATRPISDVRGSADYRRELVKVLTRRTLESCLRSLGV